MAEHIKHLIVGAGPAGAVLAERIATVLKEKVLVIDKRNHIAGNMYDYKDSNGISIHKYGPHVFHTDKEEVWAYLSQFTSWHLFFLKAHVYMDGHKVVFPVNLNTIHQLFSPSLANKLEKALIAEVGYGNKISILELRKTTNPDLIFLADYMYNKTFLPYNKKQWGYAPEDLDPTVVGRVPIYVSRDDRTFHDKYQAIPEKGYTALMENILAHPNINIRLNTAFDDIKNTITWEKLYYTGAIDEFFGYKYGQLPYRSLRFDIQEKDVDFYQETAVVSYPTNFEFTRICEYKHFLGEKSDKTSLSFEYPEDFVLGKNERYYPVPRKDNQDLYERYVQDAKKIPNLYFLGRLGDYKYYNMDAVIERAIHFFKELYQ